MGCCTGWSRLWSQNQWMAERSCCGSSQCVSPPVKKKKKKKKKSMENCAVKLCVSNWAKRCWLQAFVKELARCLNHATSEERTWCNSAHNFELELLFFSLFYELAHAQTCSWHHVGYEYYTTFEITQPQVQWFPNRCLLGTAFLSLSNLMTPDPVFNVFILLMFF